MSRAAIMRQIECLFQEAENSPQQKANELVKQARTLAMKHTLRLPSELKRKFCRHCYAYLRPGKNCTVRTSNGKLIYHCHECMQKWTMPLT